MEVRKIVKSKGGIWCMGCGRIIPPGQEWVELNGWQGCPECFERATSKAESFGC